MTRELGSNLLDIDTMASTAENQACPHGLGISLGLFDNFVSITRRRKWMSPSSLDRHTCKEISSWSSRGKFTKWSYFVPMRKGMAVLLKPRPWRYHSLIELRVLLRVRSNMNRMATASLHTRGSILTNSRCPPRSQIEKVISVLRIEMVFSMKLTPRKPPISECFDVEFWIWKIALTQSLNIILVPATFDIFDHQTCFAYLSVSNHSNLDNNAVFSKARRLASGFVLAVSWDSHIVLPPLDKPEPGRETDCWGFCW